MTHLSDFVENFIQRTGTQKVVFARQCYVARGIRSLEPSYIEWDISSAQELIKIAESLAVEEFVVCPKKKKKLFVTSNETLLSASSCQSF